MFPGKTWSLSWPDTETVLATPLVLSDSFAASHSVFWSGPPSFSSAPWSPWGGLCRFWKKKFANKKQDGITILFWGLWYLLVISRSSDLGTSVLCRVLSKHFSREVHCLPSHPKDKNFYSSFSWVVLFGLHFSQVDWWSRTTAKSVV